MKHEEKKKGGILLLLISLIVIAGAFILLYCNGEEPNYRARNISILETPYNNYYTEKVTFHWYTSREEIPSGYIVIESKYLVKVTDKASGANYEISVPMPLKPNKPVSCEIINPGTGQRPGTGNYKVVIKTYARYLRVGDFSIGEISQKADPVSFSVDMTPPSIPGNFVITAPELYESEAAGMVYVGGDEIHLEWNPSRDAHCDYPVNPDGSTPVYPGDYESLLRYNLYYFQEQTIPEFTINYTEELDLDSESYAEGLVTLYFTSFDGLLNESGKSDPVRFFLDKTGPYDVTGITGEIVSEEENGKNRVTGIRVNWDEVVNDNPEGGSGVWGYGISWIHADSFDSNPGTMLSEIITREGGTTTSAGIIFEEYGFTRGEYYYFGVRSIDNVNNRGQWILSEKIYIPHDPLKIERIVTTSATVNVDTGEPEYGQQIQFNWNKNTLYLPGSNEYSIEGIRIISDSGDEYTYGVTDIIDKGGTIKTPWEEENNKLVLNILLTGKPYAHMEYTYSVDTLHIQGVAAEYGNEITAERIQNIVADFSIRVEDESGNLLGTIDEQGYRAGTGEEVFHLYTNGKVFFHITAPHADGTDSEGDVLHYRLWTINAIHELGNAWSDLGEEGIGLLPAQSDVYHCFISVEEYTRNTGGTVISLSDVYNTNLTRTTLHNENNEGFYIHFDLNEGAGAFEIRSPDSTRVLSVTMPTATEDVSIVIQEHAITDTAGVVDTGIQAVLAWNVDMNLYTRPQDIVAEDMIAIEPEDTLKTNLGITADPGENAPDELFRIDWKLTPLSAEEQEGIRAVGLKVVDGVGNEYFYLRVVKIDALPPEKPDITTFSHSYTENSIIVTWEAGEPGESYGVWYKPDPESEEVYTEITEPRVSIPVGTYGPNQAIPLTICAIDLAGNRSEGVLYTPYTLAAIGIVEEEEQGYSESEGHFFTWRITSGTASRFVLEYLDADDTVITELPAVNRVVRHTRLTPPHGTFRYRQGAYNGNNVITHGPLFTRTLLNNAPGEPTELRPSGFGQERVKLSWRNAIDVDGDVITYFIYFKQSSDAEFQLLGETRGIECVYPEGTETLLLQEGEVYSFYIAADDSPSNNSYEGKSTSSEIVSFEVDATAPVITFPGLPADAASINNTELEVEIYDERSGVHKVWYWTSDGHGSEVHPIELDITGTGSGTYEARIPLHEGNYNVHVKAVDNAGNEAEKATDGYYVDQTIPGIKTFTTSLAQARDGYLGSTGTVPVRMTLWDNYSGIHGIQYGYASEPGGDISEWTEVDLNPVETGKEENKEEEYIRHLRLPGEDGAVYYLAVQAYDWAGNYSEEYRLDNGILLDTSKPLLTMEVTGFNEAYSRYYIKDIDQLAINLSYADEDSDVVSVLYGLKKKGSEETIFSWHTDYDGIKTEPLEPGTAYSLLVKVENSVGLDSDEESPEFVYDNSPALDLEVTGISDGAKVTGEEIRFYAKASEPESAILEYAVAIGSEENETALSGLVNGNEEGWLKIRDSREEVCFQVTVPEISDGSYILSLRVINAANSVSILDQAGMILVDNSREKVVVKTDGMYSSFPDRLSALWEYSGERIVASYSFRIMNNQEAVTGWTETDETRVTVTGLSLENGETYYFEVQALGEEGGDILTGQSEEILVDYTAPLFAGSGGLSAPLFCTSQELWVSWQTHDEESGIGRIQVLLEKAGEGNTIVPVTGGWTDVPANTTGEYVPVLTDKNGQPLNITTGDKVYLTLRVMNRAGLAREKAVPVIMIDNTAPPGPLVIDSGEVINPVQYPEAHWIWTTGDPESGTVTYEWTLVTGRDQLDTAEWYVDDGSHEAKVEEVLGEMFYREHGDTWYFAVRAVNGAGLESVGMSNGILYDETAPLIAKVKLVRGMGNDELLYIEDFSGVNILIDAYEDVSLIDHYKALPGYLDESKEWVPTAGGPEYTSEEPRFAVDNPSPEVEEKKILIFRGMCINEANLVSEYGYTKGTMVITRIPEIINLHGRTSGTELFFDWEVEQTGVPVEGYIVELRAAGTGNVVYSAFTEHNYLVIDAVTEAIGEGSYALYVKAKSIIGLYSEEWGISPVVVIDHTPPGINEFITPKYASHGIILYCEAMDDRSGISEYQYCIGVFEQPVLFTGGWESVFTKQGAVSIQVNFPDLLPGIEGVLDGSIIYARIRAKNGTGLMSADRMSHPIIIDKTPASTPVVDVGNPFTQYHYRIEGISISSTDNESGITHFAWTVVKEPDEPVLDAAVWHEIKVDGEVFSLAIENMVLDTLELEHGEEYFAAVKTRNGAGDWSEAGISPGIHADLTAPYIIFPQGPDEIVLNDTPAEIPYEIVDDVSPEVEVRFTLELPTGAMEELPLLNLSPGEYSYLFDKTAYGTYILYAELTDNAGNESEVVAQAIRVNSPPEITLGNSETTPGRPLELSAYVYDIDEPFTYDWDFGDGAHSTEPEPVHRYYHKEQYDQESVYTLTLRVADKHGKVGVARAEVTVRNTQTGELYTDEYWMGEHRIRGDILVPEGIYLTVMQETNVIIMSNPVYGNKHSLTVEGGIRLEQGARFGLEQSTGDLWNGILIQGEAGVTGAVIRDAERGLAIGASADVRLSGTRFEHNEIGVHALKTITIEGCTFAGNTLYAIKEDSGADSAVLYCVFSGNTYDFYEDELTIISIEELNTRPGCAGNIKE